MHIIRSFQAMTWVILYLQARFVRMNKSERSFFVPFCQFACFIFAFYTTLSRVSDYKHNPGDVLAGAILGILVQYVNVVHIQRLFDDPFFRRSNKIFPPPQREPSMEPNPSSALNGQVTHYDATHTA